MVHLKKEKKRKKVVLSYISNASISLWLLAIPFHFIDLSAQNAINQYHFITLIVFESSIMFWTNVWKKKDISRCKTSK